MKRVSSPPYLFCVCARVCVAVFMAPVDFTPRGQMHVQAELCDSFELLIKIILLLLLGWWNRGRLWNAVLVM